ncbi:hypothetical protein PILCRDRAFT_822673 [Piloderma croceum F 1598]|uniref:Uncharacterized protein n=1 Tax=Piloderma croceum (strain F 1598) TaxID=765440 RepID=A0A0C3FJV0_PILCF|nr:hypothetical protein PILCRDRAFT_822673 [Piloderma croceum F 1598]
MEITEPPTSCLPRAGELNRMRDKYVGNSRGPRSKWRITVPGGQDGQAPKTSTLKKTTSVVALWDFPWLVDLLAGTN